MYEEGQQLYRVIEFCKDPETLWAKIESGHWQWLGIHPSGKYVLGRPPVPIFEAHAAGTVSRPGSTPDNRIEFGAPQTWNQRHPFRDPGRSASGLPRLRRGRP
jgi:hypothetical protein